MGIIDWTDAILGDPAQDFVGLVVNVGWPFTEQVLAHYRRPVDRSFRERPDFMARPLSTVWLTEAFVQDGDVSKHVAWVRRAFGSRSIS